MTRQGRHRLRVLLCLCPLGLLLAHALGWFTLNDVGRLDNRLYDLRLVSTMPGTRDERIVIVDVDEASLTQIGHWPWSRHLVAKLLDELVVRQQVSAVGVDMVFAEPDESSGLHQLERLLAQDQTPSRPELAHWLATQTPLLDYDGQLAHALRQRPVVLGYYFSSDAAPRIGQLPPASLPADAVPASVLPSPWTGFGANLPRLSAAASAGGFFNAITDSDGRVRAVPLLARYETGIYESLALATYRAATGLSQLGLRVSAAGELTAVHLADAQGQRAQRLPTTAQGLAYVPYRGHGGASGGSYRYLSAASVLAGELPARTLAGKIVLIGSSAPGLQDVRATPVSGSFPGVEVHANLISAMWDGTLLERPDYARGYEVLLLCVIALLLVPLPSMLSLGASIALHLGVPLAVIGLDIWLFVEHRLVMPLASALLLAAFLSWINILTGYVMETRIRRQLVRMFSSYVPPERVQDMLKRPDAYSMQADARELTVMFCDLQGFTELSENMAPTDVQALLNELFTQLTDIIYAHGGTVDKYIGDCVMAFWGAPIAQPQHATQAARAALELQACAARWNAHRQAQGEPPLRIGIGLNTGMVAVGDMGSHHRRAYTVIGDAVNLAARLEALTRRYDLGIIAGERTVTLSGDAVLWRLVDRVRVKGRRQREDIYTPVGLHSELQTRDAAQVCAWNTAMRAYLAGDSAALRAWMEAAPEVNDPLQTLYRDQLQTTGPPAAVELDFDLTRLEDEAT